MVVVLLIMVAVVDSLQHLPERARGGKWAQAHPELLPRITHTASDAQRLEVPLDWNDRSAGTMTVRYYTDDRFFDGAPSPQLQKAPRMLADTQTLGQRRAVQFSCTWEVNPSARGFLPDRTVLAHTHAPSLSQKVSHPPTQHHPAPPTTTHPPHNHHHHHHHHHHYTTRYHYRTLPSNCRGQQSSLGSGH